MSNNYLIQSTLSADVIVYKFSISYADFFASLVSSENFRNTIIKIFNDHKAPYVTWEFPPYNKNSYKNLAEFALVQTHSFGAANSNSFSKYLNCKSEGEVVMFDNLSGDTKLISVNSRNSTNQAFCHIMEFMTNAPNNSKHSLLIKIGEEMLKYTSSTNSVYLSTHGHGVPWLHVRICGKPKYYLYGTYASL